MSVSCGPWASRLRQALLIVCAVATFGGRATFTAATPSDPEVRALWVLRTSLTSHESIAAMVASAHENGFNTLFVQVRGRGDALFSGALEPRATLLTGQPASFDPLQETLTRAHAAGLDVHAWVNVNLVSSATTLPASPSHLIYRHPEWLMVPRPLAAELANVQLRSPGYLGKLARWVRAQPTQLEGLYVSPVSPAAREHTVAVVSDLVARYPLDGVHLDYLRYPSDDFDYSVASLAEFRRSMASSLASPQRAMLDGRATSDPLAYPDAFPTEWTRFRQSRLTSLVMQLRTAVKARRPHAVLSAAVVPDPAAAGAERLQDWRTWVDGGLIDVVCPMVYTPDAVSFVQHLRAAQRVTAPGQLWAGIGAYRLPVAETLGRIRTTRRMGIQGLVLFSYDSLTDPQEHEADYLVQIGRGAFRDSRPLTAGSP